MQALELNPKRKDCLLARAKCFLAQDDFTAAQRDSDEYLKLDQSDPRVRTKKNKNDCMESPFDLHFHFFLSFLALVSG